MSHLYVLCGAPGSGKSTWASKQLGALFDQRKTVYVSRDQVRFSLLSDEDDYFAKEKRVFSIFVNNIVTGLIEGKNVIADATHLNRNSRKHLIEAIDRDYIDYDVHFIFFDTCLAVCQARNAARQGRQHVPEEQLERMFQQIEIPSIGEFPNCVGVWLIR